METFSYDNSAMASALIPAVPVQEMPDSSEGPEKLRAAAVSDGSSLVQATPVSSGQASAAGTCTGCQTIWPGNATGFLWTWGTLSPFFSTSAEVSHVRFYNAAAIREPINIYLNGRMVVSGLDYMNYTRFLHIIPGTYQLTVSRSSNPGTAIISSNVRFRSGTSYTLAVLGASGDFSVQMITS